jgi:hypothetical protein
MTMPASRRAFSARPMQLLTPTRGATGQLARRAALLVITGLLACSSTTIVPPRDGGVGSDGATTGNGPGTDGGDATDLENATSTPDLATPIEGYGTVYAYLTRATASTVEYESTAVGASFTYPSTTTSTASCTTTTVGDCEVTSCSGGGTGTTPPGAAAGTVTVSGGSKTVTLQTSALGPVSESTNALYWNGGQLLSVSATGATVGAFNATLVVPQQIVVTHPYLPATGSVAISRTGGLTLDWSGGQAGQAVFVLAAGSASSSTSAICRYPASQTHAVLPAQVLSMFPAGLASFSASTQDRQEKRVGGWIVNLSSYFNAVYDTDRTVAGQLQLN